ncbi:uncharacterized protein TRUGW13939_11552 [Talaromyces rugulosus]|uniref:ferric-chelate reductase (NADPH) n=1 Tax=Talaromyces rugulosus TaxID=121627 RepID=A0A7H8RED3_TALRU|nr:uncharacterized protein TRUGW13939_11552 [Talaromyces rugulosus]QKX64378.1 hypothetical protein TRUGW13939_11552 [Talaromyces rugulosus]
MLFQVQSWDEANLKTGRLALINMIPLFMTVHQSLLADILGISLQTCQWIHRASGWMVSSLVALHVLVALSIQQNLSLKRQENVFAIVGAATLGTIMIFSIPIFRKHVYELFLRTHQGLAAVSFYAIWKHIPSDSAFPRLYLYVPLAILGSTTLYQCGKLLYQNGFMSSRPNPRAMVICKKAEPNKTNKELAKQGDSENVEQVVKMTVTLGRPLEIRAGQYIQLWMPSVSFSSWLQSHPFVVTSWSPGKQDTLELFVQVRRGFTSRIYKHASPSGSASFSALVTGPFGLSYAVDQYETVLVIASGFGIAGVVPYIKQLLYGYNTSTARIRRVHLLWETKTLDLVREAQPLLNSLLTDDILDNGYILEMSFYVESTEDDKRSFGKHNRAFLYKGKPSYDQIISAEASGDYIERVSNTQEEIGDMLVLACVSDGLRDDLRKIVREYLDKKVEMREVEYQPVEIVA